MSTAPTITIENYFSRIQEIVKEKVLDNQYLMLPCKYMIFHQARKYCQDCDAFICDKCLKKHEPTHRILGIKEIINNITTKSESYLHEKNSGLESNEKIDLDENLEVDAMETIGNLIDKLNDIKLKLQSFFRFRNQLLAKYNLPENHNMKDKLVEKITTPEKIEIKEIDINKLKKVYDSIKFENNSKNLVKIFIDFCKDLDYKTKEIQMKNHYIKKISSQTEMTFAERINLKTNELNFIMSYSFIQELDAFLNKSIPKIENKVLSTEDIFKNVICACCKVEEKEYNSMLEQTQVEESNRKDNIKVNVKEVIVKKFIEVPKEVIIQKIVEIPKEVIVQKVVEVPKEKFVDVPNSQVVEKIVEVPKEVVVEKIVEVPKEVVVEKIVEVPKEVEKIVEVPVNVQKVCFAPEELFIDENKINLTFEAIEVKKVEEQNNNMPNLNINENIKYIEPKIIEVVPPSISVQPPQVPVEPPEEAPFTINIPSMPSTVEDQIPIIVNPSMPPEIDTKIPIINAPTEVSSSNILGKGAKILKKAFNFFDKKQENKVEGETEPPQEKKVEEEEEEKAVIVKKGSKYYLDGKNEVEVYTNTCYQKLTELNSKKAKGELDLAKELAKFTWKERSLIEIIFPVEDQNCICLYNPYINNVEQMKLLTDLKFPINISILYRLPYCIISGGRIKNPDTDEFESLSTIYALRRSGKRKFEKIMLPDMPEAKSGHCLVDCGSLNAICAVGGKNSKTALCYYINDKNWDKFPELNFCREGPACCVLNDCILYCFFGYDNENSNYLTSVEKLDLTLQDKWELFTPSGPPSFMKRKYSSCVRYRMNLSDTVIICGGINVLNSESKDCLEFNDKKQSIEKKSQTQLPLKLSFNSSIFAPLPSGVHCNLSVDYQLIQYEPLGKIFYEKREN